MNRTSFLIIAWCMMCISACTTQQKENVGTLPVVDFEQEYPEESLLVSEHADVEYVRLETSDEVLLDGIAGFYLSVTDRYIVFSYSIAKGNICTILCAKAAAVKNLCMPERCV